MDMKRINYTFTHVLHIHASIGFKGLTILIGGREKTNWRVSSFFASLPFRSGLTCATAHLSFDQPDDRDWPGCFVVEANGFERRVATFQWDRISNRGGCRVTFGLRFVRWHVVHSDGNQGVN